MMGEPLGELFDMLEGYLEKNPEMQTTLGKIKGLGGDLAVIDILPDASLHIRGRRREELVETLKTADRSKVTARKDSLSKKGRSEVRQIITALKSPPPDGMPFIPSVQVLILHDKGWRFGRVALGNGKN